MEKYFIVDVFKRLWLASGNYSFSADENGIIQISYPQTNYRTSGVSCQYHPTAISAYALSQFNMFVETGDEQCKRCFLNYADWLVDNLAEGNGFAAWNFSFDWKSPGYKCKPPWASSMTQGMSISVLVRAWKLTGEMRYFTAAERALSIFEVPFPQGGLLRTDKQGDTWYEGTPSPIGAQILNEVLFALIGLYEMHRSTGNSKARELFDQGVRTLKRRLGDFDLNLPFFKWSRYDNKLLFYAGDKYHDIQVEQLKWLSQVTGEGIFGEHYRKWEGYQKRYASRGRFTAKYMFELIYSLIYGRFLSFYTKHLQR